MQLDQALLGLETAVETQLRVAGPEATELGAQLMAALQPAIVRTSSTSSAPPPPRLQPAGGPEGGGQDGGQRSRLVVTRDDSGTSARFDDDDDIDMSETRITVRLPSNLKEIIADAAQAAGDSLTAFVVDALKTQTRATRNVGKTRVRTTIDL